LKLKGTKPHKEARNQLADKIKNAFAKQKQIVAEHMKSDKDNRKYLN
jgi:hypothetical protein